MTNSTLMSAKQPSFQQRDSSVAMGEKILSSTSLFMYNLPDITQIIQVVISSPIIGLHYTARLNRFLNSFIKTCSRSILNSSKPYSADMPSIYLCSNEYQCLALSAATSLSRFFATDKCFVHLNCSCEPIATRPDHSTTKLMQPCPSRLVTAQSQNPLKPFCVGTILLAGHPPNCPEPYRQRQSGPLKNCPSFYRGLISTFRTFIQTPVCKPCLGVFTSLADKAIGPTKSQQVLNTCFFCGKLLLKFQQVFWVILHRLPILYVGTG